MMRMIDRTGHGEYPSPKRAHEFAAAPAAAAENEHQAEDIGCWHVARGLGAPAHGQSELLQQNKPNHQMSTATKPTDFTQTK